MPEANVQAPNRPRQAGPVLRIRSLRLDGPSVRCATDGEDILVPRVPASYLRPGDDLCVGVFSSPIHEYLATQNGLRRKARQLYFGRIGYVAQPKADKRGEYFVRAEVLESALGIRCAPSTEQRRARLLLLLHADATREETADALRSLAHAANSDARRFAALVQDLSPGA